MFYNIKIGDKMRQKKEEHPTCSSRQAVCYASTQKLKTFDVLG